MKAAHGVMYYYPVFLNLERKRVVLFGGGQVALRKARALVKSGADLVVISRGFSAPFLRFARRNRIKIRYASALAETLNAASLVIAATSDPVFNHKVYQKCKQEGIFVNVVDDPAHSTFIVPSLVKRGALQIAISTGGASPLLARLLRKKLSTQFGAGYGQLVRWLERDRKTAKRLIGVQNQRRNHFQKLIQSRLKVLEDRNFKKG